jgi:hypothetical protein
MIRSHEVLRDLFDPADVSQVNATNKLPIYSQFTWTQDVYTLERVSVPKLVTEVRQRLQVTKELLDKKKQTLPLNSERPGDIKLGAREVKTKLASEASHLKKTENTKSYDNLHNSLRTEENSKLLRSTSRQAYCKLKKNLEAIASLARSSNNDSSVQAFITEQLRRKKYPDQEESKRLFNATTILSKCTLRKKQELQTRFTSSFMKFNPSKGSSTTFALEAAGNVVRSKYVSSQRPKTMMMRLKGLLKAQSKLKGQGVPFSLLHTLA